MEMQGRMVTGTQNWPVEYADQLIIGNPASNVAICCLWSNRDRLRASITPGTYAVMGNLYSRAGINPMLRNILSNPSIRYLVLTGRSLTDSDAALTCYFNGGVDAEWKVVGNGAQVERDLPLEALNDVRKGVELIDLRGSRNFVGRFQQLIKRLDPLPAFASPRTFRKSSPVAQTFPSEFVGFVVRKRTVYEAWNEIIQTVMMFGHTSSTDYGLEQKEVLALLSIVEDSQAGLDDVQIGRAHV
jgi:thymidylate synthase